MANEIASRIVSIIAIALLSSSTVLGAEMSKQDALAVNQYLDTRSFERPIDRGNAKRSVRVIEGLTYLGQLPGVRFLVFPTEASSLSGHVAIAVDDNGEAFEVAEEFDFNRLMRSLDLNVNSANPAEQVARDYLRLRHIHAEVWEGVKGGVNFISQVDDIPFEEGNPEHAIEQLDLELYGGITAPSTKPSGTGFEFHAFTWVPFTGTVAEHTLFVDSDGTVRSRYSEIAHPYGAYTTGCTFPLDEGPNTDVLTRLAVQPASHVRAAVAEYLDHLVVSNFVPHQWFVKDHHAELTEIAKRLASSSEESVRVPAEQALAVLRSRNEAR